MACEVDQSMVFLRGSHQRLGLGGSCPANISVTAEPKTSGEGNRKEEMLQCDNSYALLVTSDCTCVHETLLCSCKYL